MAFSPSCTARCTDNAVREHMIALASHVALAWSPVDRDRRSDIRLVLDPEAPTRIVKVLTRVWRAAGLLGLGRVGGLGDNFVASAPRLDSETAAVGARLPRTLLRTGHRQ
jgi:hypothetical protein